MDTKMLKKIGTVFKYGARVIQDGQPPVNMTHFSYAESESGVPTILGWAFPNKDKYFEVTGLEDREDGWLLQANGTRYLFKPLSKDVGQALASDMKGA